MTDTTAHKLADIAAPIMARLNVSVGDSHHFTSEERWLIIKALQNHAEQTDNLARICHRIHLSAGATVARALESEAQRCKDIAFVIDTSPLLCVDRALTEALG